jgi:hypothetical protein
MPSQNYLQFDHVLSLHLMMEHLAIIEDEEETGDSVDKHFT